MKMKRTTLAVVLTIAAFTTYFLVSEVNAQMMGPGMGPGYGGWYCPWCGRWMGGPGPGMGPGMMGPGMMGPGYFCKPLEEKDVKVLLENYIRSTRNPNLKLGKISDQQSYFEAEIVTKDNSLVDKIQVDKNTGWFRSVY